MKYLLVSLLLVTVVWAEKVPNEADYPTEYQVVTASAISGGLMLGNFCTMGLRDETHTFIVQKRGHGGYHVWDSKAIFHGRREKSGISLLVQDKGKLKIEHWPIAGTVMANSAITH